MTLTSRRLAALLWAMSIDVAIADDDLQALRAHLDDA
jgi:hypothetical protein